MGEPGRIQAFLGWWRELPTGWRVNVGLYVLAGLSLVALLTQMLVGGDTGPRRVEVAAGRRAPARPTTTAVAASTTLSPTSTVPPLTTAPPATSPNSSAPTRAFTGGKPAGGGGGGSPATFAPAPPTTVQCGRNGTDDRCGGLVWDPPPGPNTGLTITVDGPTTATVGQAVTFTVRATDPDHLVTGHCTRADFGDGSVKEEPCNPPPCANARGTWDTPPKQSGSGEITYQHTFDREGTFTMRFTFHTDKDRCPDPYGSVGTQTHTVTVTATA